MALWGPLCPVVEGHREATWPEHPRGLTVWENRRVFTFQLFPTPRHPVGQCGSCQLMEYCCHGERHEMLTSPENPCNSYLKILCFFQTPLQTQNQPLRRPSPALPSSAGRVEPVKGGSAELKDERGQETKTDQKLSFYM